MTNLLERLIYIPSDEFVIILRHFDEFVTQHKLYHLYIMTYKSYKQRLNIKLGLDEDTEHTLKQLKDITVLLSAPECTMRASSEVRSDNPHGAAGKAA